MVTKMITTTFPKILQALFMTAAFSMSPYFCSKKDNSIFASALSLSPSPLSSTGVSSRLQPPQPLKAILFDIDGTLVNSDPIHFKVFQELLLEQDGINNNQPIDEAFFRKWISGRANALITADLFPDWTVAQREEWSRQKEARFRQVAQATMADSKMPGLDKLRSWMDDQKIINIDNDSPNNSFENKQQQQQKQQQQYLPLHKAAVTNAPRLNAEAILQGIGYSDWFGTDALIIGDECERPKPDPCPYLTACKIFGLTDASNCIVFEDSPSGAKAGVSAGAFVVGILSGQDRTTLETAGCHLIIEDYNDPKLWDLLESITPK